MATEVGISARRNTFRPRRSSSPSSQVQYQTAFRHQPTTIAQLFVTAELASVDRCSVPDRPKIFSPSSLPGLSG